jgi:hypothetical protein
MDCSEEKVFEELFKIILVLVFCHCSINFLSSEIMRNNATVLRNYRPSGVRTQTKKDLTKKMVKRAAHLQYYYDLLAPVCKENENMFVARIGRGKSS